MPQSILGRRLNASAHALCTRDFAHLDPPLSCSMLKPLALLLFATTAVCETAPSIPDINAILAARGTSFAWTVGADGATCLQPAISEDGRVLWSTLVPFPGEGKQKPVIDGLQCLLASGPFGYASLLFNGGQDLASCSDLDTHARRFAWDISDAGLSQRLSHAGAQGDRRAELDRLVAVRLMQRHHPDQRESELAHDADPWIASTQTPFGSADASPLPWVRSLKLHEDLVAVWQPGVYPALAGGMATARQISSPFSVMKRQVRSQYFEHLAPGKRMRD